MASTKVAQRGATAEAAETAQPAEAAQPAERQGAPARRTAIVNLPFVTAEFRAPQIHLPSLPVRAPARSDLSGAVSAIRAHLPSPGQAVYYAGLGVLGVLELIEWPVALAIGVGTAVAQQHGGAGPSEPEQRNPGGKDAIAL